MKSCFIILLLCVFAGCVTSDSRVHESPALKNAFKKDFLVGAALNPNQFSGTNDGDCEVALIKKQFNSISPENVLKWERVHPWPGIYNFAPADAYVQFGIKNKMFIIGHNLVWHLQTPDWVFRDEHGLPLGRDALLQRMREHIFTVVGRYKGRIGGWDVVNEAVDGDGSLIQSPWLKIIGKDYLLKAFQFAHEADPKAELYYNDNSMENAPKRAGVIAMIKELQAQGAPITGIGMQGHYSMEWPAPSELEQTITAFSDLGLKVMITELDVNVVLPANESLSDAKQEALARRYADLFKVFVKHRGQISRVTFWGVTDADSWFNYMSGLGSKAYPLLFGRGCSPKPAFDAVVAVGLGKGQTNN
jgi:endo-1,4-beta-xylanase